jgi:3',5'-cyclic AMP phosphodiesterase CpdA
MSRILHLSDLHFGTEIPGLPQRLLDTIHALAPDLVVISGDLTQRARRHQFRAAADFVAALGVAHLVVPGNHDVPLFNLFNRLIGPFRRYRRFMGPDMAPVWRSKDALVVGLNSVDPYSHQKGDYRDAALAATEAVLRAAPARQTKIVVAHHPVEHEAGVEKDLARHAGEAIDRLAAAGADILLCGHLHMWRATPVAPVQDRRDLLQVQAGTALSQRLRGQPNDFNLLQVAGDSLTVTRYVAASAGLFAPIRNSDFRYGPKGWVQQTEGDNVIALRRKSAP